MKKLGIFILSIIIGSSVLSAVFEDNSSNTTYSKPQIQNTANVVDVLEDYKVDNSVKTKSTNNNLSNDNYYTNSDGEKVHSPAYAPSIPAGASAKCRDGTYSFSHSRRGTCSHHGGVSVWY